MLFDDEETRSERKRKETRREGVRVIIEGKVQKVGYRNWLISQASRLGVDGWVRNKMNGTVEAVFVAPQKEIADLVALCYKGPPMASVSKVKQYPFQEKHTVRKGFVQLSNA